MLQIIVVEKKPEIVVPKKCKPLVTLPWFPSSWMDPMANILFWNM